MEAQYSYMVIERTGLDGEENFEIQGGYIRVQALNGGNMTVKLHDKTRDEIPLKIGEEIFMPFKRFIVKTDAATDFTLFVSSSKELAVGGVAVSTSGSVNVSGTASIDTVSVLTTATEIVPANARTSLILKPSGTIWIGFSSGITAAGDDSWEISGEFVLDNYNGIVYGIASGAAVDCQYLQEGA